MFIKQAQMEKTAEFKLSNDVTKWNEEILKRLFEENDWLDVDTYYVNWKKSFDGEKGFASGVVVLEKDKHVVSIPVLVKNYKLQPMDIFYRSETKDLYPLTKKTIENAFFDTSVADKLVKNRGSGENIIKNLFPPRYGRTVLASVNTSLLKSISISEEDTADFSARVKQAEVLSTAENAGGNFIKVAKYILKKQPKEINNIFSDIEKQASVIVTPDDKTGYKLYQVKEDQTLVKTASYVEVLKTLRQELGFTKKAADRYLTEVDNGETVGITTMPMATAILDSDLKSRIKTAMPAETSDNNDTDNTRKPVDFVTRAGRYKTFTKSGNELKAYVLPVTYALETGKPTKQKLLIDENKDILAFEPDIVGRPDNGSHVSSILRTNKIKFPKRNMLISFGWYDNKLGEYVGIQPAKMLSYQEIANTGTLFTVISPFGSTRKILVMDKVTQANFDRKNQYDAIVLPQDVSLLTVTDEGLKDLIQNPDEYADLMTKEASVIYGWYSPSTNEITLKENGLTKIASDPNNAITELFNRGIELNLCNRFVKEAKMKGSSKMFVQYPELEKKASLDEKEKEQKIEFAVDELRSIRDEYDLVKIGSGINDLETLDKVLGINFINKRNIVVFFKMLPQFKETTMKLAQLLLGARIGNIGIDEKYISDAMKAMQALVEKMEGFQVDKA